MDNTGSLPGFLEISDNIKAKDYPFVFVSHQNTLESHRNSPSPTFSYNRRTTETRATITSPNHLCIPCGKVGKLDEGNKPRIYSKRLYTIRKVETSRPNTCSPDYGSIKSKVCFK